MKQWKIQWVTLSAKIADHKKITEQLESERVDLVKKMDHYFTVLKGTAGQNILEQTTKLKKTITKAEPVKDKDHLDEEESDTDSSDSDDSDEDTDDEATPAEPLKKFTAKNKKDESDSDSE